MRVRNPQQWRSVVFPWCPVVRLYEYGHTIAGSCFVESSLDAVLVLVNSYVYQSQRYRRCHFGLPAGDRHGWNARYCGERLT